MDSVKEYLEYAAQCVALATKASDSADKARLLQMAQAWRELAEKLEHRKSTDRDDSK